MNSIKYLLPEEKDALRNKIASEQMMAMRIAGYNNLDVIVKEAVKASDALMKELEK